MQLWKVNTVNSVKYVVAENIAEALLGIIGVVSCELIAETNPKDISAPTLYLPS